MPTGIINIYIIILYTTDLELQPCSIFMLCTIACLPIASIPAFRSPESSLDIDCWMSYFEIWKECEWSNMLVLVSCMWQRSGLLQKNVNWEVSQYHYRPCRILFQPLWWYNYRAHRSNLNVLIEHGCKVAKTPWCKNVVEPVLQENIDENNDQSMLECFDCTESHYIWELRIWCIKV